MPAVQETIERVRRIDVDQYKYGFVTDIESDKAPKGLSEDTVRFISAKKNEPEWMLAWRLDAYRRWLTMKEPNWARVDYNKIDYQDLYYYSAPKKKGGPKSLDEIDPEILRTYEKLGIPLREQKILAGVVEDKPEDLDADGEARPANGNRRASACTHGPGPRSAANASSCSERSSPTTIRPGWVSSRDIGPDPHARSSTVSAVAETARASHR